MGHEVRRADLIGNEQVSIPQFVPRFLKVFMSL